MLVTAALTCLALNIYHESRGESIDGQIAVALVTRNRMRIQNKTACEIVFENKQFSWANNINKKISNNKIEIDKQYLPDQTDKNWLRALYIAEASTRMRDYTDGSTHYHENSINPWPNMKVTMVIGNHTFCKNEKY